MFTSNKTTSRYTYEVLAKAMDSVYVAFGITDKIDFSTTDNWSNFVKRFK